MSWTWSFRIGLVSGREWLELDFGGSGKGSAVAKRLGRGLLGTLRLGSGAGRGLGQELIGEGVALNGVARFMGEPRS